MIGVPAGYRLAVLLRAAFPRCVAHEIRLLPPFVITESGAALAGEVQPDGQIDDSTRIDYLTRHLEAVATAIKMGVDVQGFYVWSLLDAWEWNDGFQPRYGLVDVDHVTQVRRPKRSFAWYAELVAAHRS